MPMAMRCSSSRSPLARFTMAVATAWDEGLNLNHVRIVNLAQLNEEARKP